MKSALNNKFALFSVDILIILLCISGLYLILIKASLPFHTTISNDHLSISKIDNKIPDLSVNDILLKIEDKEFKHWEEIELYLDGKNIGDKIKLTIMRNGSERLIVVKLVSYYSFFELLIIGIVGLFFIVFAILVRIKAPENNSAKVFHLASLGLGMVIMMTAGNYNFAPFGLGYANRIIWLIAYSFTPVIFIHFTSSFAKRKVKRITNVLWLFYLSALINAIILSYLFLDATVGDNFQSLKNYVVFFDSIFRIFLITCIIIAISICIYAYKSANDIEERKRLQWLLLGFFIGPFSFVIFWVIPIFLIGYSLIPESLVLIFLTAIPITFSIAIVKYHLMNINLIVRRSVVYTIILGIIIFTYIGISSLITLFVSDINPAFPSVITAFAVVALLQPVKNAIQKFVDRKFFRVEYDYREEQQRFLDEIKNIFDIHSLADLIVNRTDNLIPVEKIGFFELVKETGRVKIIANKGWEMLHSRSIRFESENLKTDLSIPLAVDDRVEPGLKIESADIKVFRRWGMVIVFPAKSPTGVIHGFLVLGAKKSGMRFLKDDVDLLNAVVFATALATDRIKLQEELIREHLESERLKELNDVKSLFVSSMVHELKKPLTGIKLFTDILKNNPHTEEGTDKKYLSIIDGESIKLEALINNILENAMIEKGIKNYQMSKVEINNLIRNTLCNVDYIFKIKNQQLKISLLNKKVFVLADDKSIESMLINLLSNASKYSSASTTTTIVTFLLENQVVIEISDQGKGIEEIDLQNIFLPYFRIRKTGSTAVEGTGLGLSIVKHIVEAHNGKINVESKPGNGTKFTVMLPVIN